MTTINWSSIEKLYRAGKSPYAISKQLGGQPTRQGIQKHAIKHGWQRRQLVEPDQLTKDNWLRRCQHSNSVGAKDTPEMRALILSQIEFGAPKVLAATLSGISAETLRTWCDRDQVFLAQIQEAERIKVSARIQRIEAAGKRGDWKADRFLLQSDPTTKEIFVNSRVKGANVINVTLNIPRASPSERPAVIEHEG